jgi:hypothetical protein
MPKRFKMVFHTTNHMTLVSQEKLPCCRFELFFISHNAQLTRNLCAVGFVVKLSDSETTKPTARKLSSAAACYAALNLNLVTDFKSTSCFACHRSYWYCIANQLSGVRPRDLDRRSAIVGLIALWQLIILFIVEEDTPKLSANALTLVPYGSI